MRKVKFTIVRYIYRIRINDLQILETKGLSRITFVVMKRSVLKARDHKTLGYVGKVYHNSNETNENSNISYNR